MLFMIIISSASAGELNTAEDLAIDEELSIDNGDSINLDEELEDNAISTENEELEETQSDNSKETLSDSNSITVEDKRFSGIQTAINDANVGDTITLDGTYSNDQSNDIYVTKSLTFVGINNATLDAGKLSGIFNISVDGVSFKDITFINGKKSDVLAYGAAVYGNGTFLNCTFKENQVNEVGGVICGKCYVADSTFINNSASFGGAIYGNGTVINCIFNDNYADENGGAIYGNCHVMNSTFTNNTAAISSGAMSGGYAENCTFINNSLKYTNPYFGGGAMSSGSAVNCTFINNSAINYGGAMYESSAVNCTFINNSASSGGALCDCSAENCNFINNSANIGGASFINRSFDYPILNCSFINNSANNNSGGAVWINGSGSVINCSFLNNSAESYGGAVYCMDGNIFSNCNFTGNFAYSPADRFYRYGGALYCVGDNTFTNCNFINNAASHGSAFFSDNKKITILFCNFVNNSDGSDRNVFESMSVTEYYVVNCSFVNETGFLSIGRGSVVNCSFENIRIISLSGSSVVGSSYVASVEGCRFVNNSKIYIYGAPVTNCSFVNNIANDKNDIRAPICIFDSTHNKGLCNISDCIFVNNSASSGGAIYWVAENGSINNCNFTNNSASSGGAIYWVAEKGTISNCNFTNNSAADSGGAIYLNNFTNSVNISNCDFRNNSVSNNYFGVNRGGGAICLIGNGIHIKNCTFISNLAKYSNGGAIFLNNSVITNDLGGKNILSSSVLSENTNTNILEQSTFETNDAAYGKAIFSEGETNIIFNEFIIYPDENGTDLFSGISLADLISNHNNFNNVKYKSNISANNVSVDFTQRIILSISSEYANGVNLTIFDQDGIIIYNNDSVSANGNFLVPALPIGEYTAKLVSIINESSTEGSQCDITISISKTKSTVSASSVSTYYGKTFSVNVVSENATSIKYVIKNSAGKQVKSGTLSPGASITGLSFAPGTYTLTLTAVVDGNHTGSSASSKITVNKATANITASALTTYYNSGKTWSITLKDKTNNKVLASKKLTLKVYTGSKYKTYTVTTNSKGVATFKASTLAPGSHKVIVSYSNSNYTTKSLTKTLKINKMTLSYKVSKSTQKDGAGLHIWVKNKATGKLINKIKIKLLVYTGKKYKTITLVSAKYSSKGNGYVGYAVKGPVYSVGTHTVKIMAGDSYHTGSVKSSLVLKSTVKKYSKKTITISKGKRTVKKG